MDLRKNPVLIIGSILMVILVIILVTRQFETPTEDLKPSIPEQISRGEGQEPILNVYVVDNQGVNEMHMEEYVAAVVAGEMDNDWPVKALAAQAILARTYVLEFIEEKGGSKYGEADISTDIEEAQAWDIEKVNENIMDAVEMTRGEVVVYDGEFIKAWFHAHAGGKTAEAKEGLDYQGDEPPYISVLNSPDADAGPEDNRNWRAEYSLNELSNLLGDVGVESENITNVEVVETGPSGRATSIAVNDTSVSAPEFRLALDSTRMKSTFIENIDINNETLIIEGKGYGHGVGMSQWGARVLAERGNTPEDIVEFFFNDIEIVNLW